MHADSPIRTVADLVAAARKPGAITVGTQGIGSAGHISALSLGQAAGIKLTAVPFQGPRRPASRLLGKRSSTAP